MIRRGTGGRSAIPRGEFENRWSTWHQMLLDRGFDGYVVWGKGASALDGYADLLWLTNHYPWTPTIRMSDGFFGSGHAAVVGDLREEPTLVADSDDYRRDYVQVGDVRVSNDVARTVVEVLDEKRLTTGRIALVADHGPSVGMYRRMIAHGRRVDWVPADGLIESARLTKSPWELAAIAESARLGQESLEAILDVASRPGTTEGDAVAAGYAVCVRNGAQPLDAFVSSGPYTKNHSYGRLPSWTTRELKAGDMFAIDWSGVLDGYWFDCGRTVIVGGRPTTEQQHALHAASAAVETAMSLMRPGVRAGDVYAAIRRQLTDHGIDFAPRQSCLGCGPAMPSLIEAAYHGHGIGLFWETPWIVEDESAQLAESTAFNIEVVAGSDSVGWAKLEEEMIITATGVERVMDLPLVL